MEFAVNIVEIRLPTSSTIESKSSCFASAAPISLMRASSSFRWRVPSMARTRLSADADVLADEGEQLAVGVRVVHVLVGLADDDADGLSVCLEGCPQPVAFADHADELELALRDELGVALRVDDRRATGPQDVRRRAPGIPDAERLPQVGVRDVGVDRVHVVREVDRLALVVVERDIEVLGRHQRPDGRVDLAIEGLEVARRAGGFGDAVERGLDPLRAGVFSLARFQLRDAMRGACRDWRRRAGCRSAASVSRPRCSLRRAVTAGARRASIPPARVPAVRFATQPRSEPQLRSR